MSEGQTEQRTIFDRILPKGFLSSAGEISLVTRRVIEIASSTEEFAAGRPGVSMLVERLTELQGRDLDPSGSDVHGYDTLRQLTAGNLPYALQDQLEIKLLEGGEE